MVTRLLFETVAFDDFLNLSENEAESKNNHITVLSVEMKPKGYDEELTDSLLWWNPKDEKALPVVQQSFCSSLYFWIETIAESNAEIVHPLPHVLSIEQRLFSGLQYPGNEHLGPLHVPIIRCTEKPDIFALFHLGYSDEQTAH